jgi:membrane-bound lytic murein transglycosylase A
MIKHIASTGLLALLTACAAVPPSQMGTPVCPAPPPCPVCPVCPVAAEAPPPVSVLAPVGFDDLPGWRDDSLDGALDALRASCHSLRARSEWREACAAAEQIGAQNADALRRYFETYFIPHRVANPDGATQGLITGYYEPLLRGSREKHGPFRYPLYAPPDDLLVIDLAAVNPDLKNLRLRGRLDGRRVVPYYTRADIENGLAPVAGKEIAWVDDAIEAFFLQIQGSGRIRLENGDTLRVGYADQNGHPYQSVGRYLVDRGELKLSEASMDGIKAWARAHPLRVDEMLNANPSYVFFRELPARSSGREPAGNGPVGALGVPLTPRRSIAVDPRHVPLGAPVYLATTAPNSDAPLERLTFAQDTGGAIRGPVRADFFWGFGAEAGALAGRMRQQGRMWVLLPRGYPPPGP